MRSVIALFGLTLCFAMATASGADAKTYTEGAVTELTFIKIKPGKFDDYMKYLSTTYKTVMEANKKAGKAKPRSTAKRCAKCSAVNWFGNSC